MEKVPLAAKVLDVRESQKLKIIEALKLERQRLRFEAEIGKAPPLSDDELSEHIREEAYVTLLLCFFPSDTCLEDVMNSNNVWKFS